MTRPKGMDTESRAPVLYWCAAFLFGLLIALVWAFEPAKAAANCVSPDDAKERASKSGGFVVAMEETGDAAKFIINRVNKAGKPTNYQGDQIIMWRRPPFPPSQMMFFKDGCATVACIHGRGCTEFKAAKKPGRET